jgi:hypothetical protein
MGVFEEKLSWFFSSRGEGVELQKTANGDDFGNRFKVTLRSPLSVPAVATYATLEVVSVTVWNNSFNISSSFGNNHFYITQQPNPELDIVIVDGLYGVGELEQYILNQCELNGLPNDLITITGDASTQKVIINMLYPNTIITFKPDSCYQVLGFNVNSVLLTVNSPHFGNNVAAFNRVSGYFIQTDLIQEGIPANASQQGLISAVPINVPTGSLITYNAFNPLPCNASSLIGNGKQTISFALLDQDLRDVSTNGEEWSLAILIRYYYDDNHFDKRFTRRL